MIGRDAPLTLRVQYVAAMLFFAVCAVFSGWLGYGVVMHILRDSAIGVPLVEFRSYYAACVTLALGFVALIIRGLLATSIETPRTRGREKAAERRTRAADVAFGAFAVFALLTPLAPLAARVAAGELMRGRGYVVCPDHVFERHAPMRWVRGDGRCP